MSNGRLNVVIYRSHMQLARPTHPDGDSRSLTKYQRISRYVTLRALNDRVSIKETSIAYYQGVATIGVYYRANRVMHLI
jgi:hypothetical protein